MKSKVLHITRERRSSPKYPKSIFFIIGNEFCERFTFYGLKAVLTIYLTKQLLYDGNDATMIFHLFSMFAYFTPVLGAIIADSWLGKFRTILYISILYAAGSVVLSVGASPMNLDIMKITSMVGLIIIAFGTGGIKPCVSAFGGDQFEPEQEKERESFFFLFYLAINLGSVVSTFLTPILRDDVHCFGVDSCFPLAFGVPAALMIVAVIVFIAGKFLYKLKPPTGNIIVLVSKCICYALGKKIKSTEKKRDHWLDYADDKFDKNLIKDIKVVLHVLVLYIPLPVFWALFDQQGSRWTLQATRMNGEVNGYHIKPDQVQVLNPFLIIAFIPLFQQCVYPLLSKCNLLTKPLQRITVGGYIAALSFVIAGFVEMNVEGVLPVLPKAGESELIIINNSPCIVKINQLEGSINAFQNRTVPELTIGETHSWEFQANCTSPVEPFSLAFNSSSPVESMMITVKDGKLHVLKGNDSKIKSDSGEPRVRIFYNINPPSENFTFLFFNANKGSKFYVGEVVYGDSFGTTKYFTLPPGHYKVYVPYNSTDYFETPVGEIRLSSGASYIVSIFELEGEKNFGVLQTIQSNTVHLFYQIPQYVVITAGEIMFSITGLEFSYSQAPESMKSLVAAAWLLTVAFGNVIVFIIAKLSLFEKQSHELFFFAALMAIDMLIFAIMAYFYKYVNPESSNSVQLATTSTTGKNNEAFVEETDLKTER